MFSNRRFIEIKYSIAWYIGTVLSFLLYFSGITTVYVYLRKRFLKHHITIVLTYHRISDDKDDHDITVTTKNFEQQIRYLKKNFNIVSLDEVVNRYKNKIQLDKDTIAITFDDGYKDNYTNAYPILRKYNVPAAIFIITCFIDLNSNMLNSNDIKIMQKGGITFGTHTITHKVLTETDRENASSEINGSKSALEKILQEKLNYFAYPKGKKRDFTNETMQMVKEAGYIAAFSTENGCIDGKSNIFELKRIGIRDCPLFVFKVRVSNIFESKWFYILRKYVGLT